MVIMLFHFHADFKTQDEKDFLKIFKGSSKTLLHTLSGPYLGKRIND